MFKRSFCGLVVLASLVAFSDAAQAQTKVLSGVLRNDTHLVITYQVRLNNGAWMTHTLRPQQALAYSLPYPRGVNQTVYVRFDNTLGDGRITFTNTTIVMHVCSHPNYGWLQRFIIVNSGRNVTIAR